MSVSVIVNKYMGINEYVYIYIYIFLTTLYERNYLWS